MRVHFVSPPTFEPWDYRNPDTQGIGGSEVAHIECAWRLARRGYEVRCFGPVPECIEECPDAVRIQNQSAREWRGTFWAHCKHIPHDVPGVFILSRCPDLIDKFSGRDDQRLWLVCQDADYQHVKGGINPERAAKLERIVALCAAHAHHLKRLYPHAAHKVCISTNGIKVDLMRELDKQALPRNPHRIVYASSPDRGLVPLLHIFRRARERVPDLELRIAYGFDNIDKVIATHPGGESARLKREVMALAEQPGVTWLGRLPQRKLLEELFQAGLWVYCTSFKETSCISAAEAQACGCVPICSPIWAVSENVGAGEQIEGDADDPLTRARFVAAIEEWCDPAGQEIIRKPMMDAARTRFNWERVIDQYESWLLGGDQGDWVAQYCFQHKHATGKILNLGCNNDSAHFADRGALNVDITDWDEACRRPNAAHLLADARSLPSELHERFDSAILGDILEHMTPPDTVTALRQAKKCLSPNGKVIITYPEDERTELDNGMDYAPGVRAFHARTIGLEEMLGFVKEAGLTAEIVQSLDYSFSAGHGIVAK